ncbi:FAD-binding oxidoreductase [Sulfitobacter sp. S190]|uniref:FAD-binding oxidoreductase n=1 Tax=Sulfitobacter sp. S190 TaxID=2867022 RepID=UPI0021A3A9E2|nr:FAD-binding oxidoreductase [Sulfitobacter sp. S190]UWR22654.1 flavodoxin reductase [Sulfitobacter sp. S190]
MTHTIKLKEKEALTPDTNRYVFERPANLDFKPGQATELSLTKDGWRDEGRPFTFTSQPDDDHLEFVIKSYPSHDGVTEQLADLQPGDEVQMEEPFGAIRDHGPGVFLAAGAGITPFIPILEKHDAMGEMDCTLIFTNKTEADIILRDKWEAMAGLSTHFTVTDQDDASVETAKIDKAYLSQHIGDFDQTFYLCGPQEFVDDVRDGLKTLGAKDDKIITEEGW